MTSKKTRPARPLIAVVLLCLMPLLSGCTEAPEDWERAYVVTVFLDTDTTEDRTYEVAVLQNGAVVDSRTRESMGGFPFRNIVFSPSMQAGKVEVRIQENGVDLASTYVNPLDCPSGEVAVTITANDHGATMTAACN